MTKSITLSRAAAPMAAVLGYCLLALACPVSAFASAAAKESGENTPLNLSSSTGTSHTSSSTGPSLVRTIVGLLIVIAVIWGLSWILRQFKAGRDPQVSSTGLTNVAALTLGSGRSLHLVRAGNDYLLLGSAEHGLIPIHRYTEQQAREAGLLLAEEAVPARPRRKPLQLTAGKQVQVDTPRAPSGQPRQADPMGMPTTSADLLDRVREWTVRR